MIRTLLACTFVISSAAAQTPVPANDGDSVSSFGSLIKSEQFADAQTALETYTAHHPESWRAQYQLGYVYFRLHKIQPSVVHLCKSLLMNDKFAESHKILAYDLNILGHPDRAIVELERSIQLDPGIAESYYELGRIYYEEGAYVQAVGQLEKAKVLNPESVRVYHNLGLAYAGLSDKSKAVENFEEGLRRNRQEAKMSAWPLIDYGTYLNLQSEFSRARSMLVEAISIDPTWDQAFDELSKADRGLGELTEAINALEHAVAINSSKPEYHYVLAQLYRQTRRQTKADKELALYRRVRSPSPKP